MEARLRLAGPERFAGAVLVGLRAGLWARAAAHLGAEAERQARVGPRGRGAGAGGGAVGGPRARAARPTRPRSVSLAVSLATRSRPGRAHDPRRLGDLLVGLGMAAIGVDVPLHSLGVALGLP